MSEYPQNREWVVQSLYEFSMGLILGGNGSELIRQHEEALEQVFPEDVIRVVDMLVLSGEPTSKIRKEKKGILLDKNERKGDPDRILWPVRQVREI